MVIPALIDNPPTGIDYTDLSNFLSTVDVGFIYNSDVTQAELIAPHRCTALCAANDCSEQTYEGCMRIFSAKLGGVEVVPTPTTNICGPRGYEHMRLHYRAGRWLQATTLMESAIIRLAHSLMPEELCFCDVWQRLWRRDTHKPQWTTIERHNNPFGLSDGAWVAWQFVNTPDMRLHRARIA
jgi:hypothetical protein